MGGPALLATRVWNPPAASAGPDPPPVALLIHGITGWSRTWWRVGPALAERGWQALALDLRGHGNSPPIGSIATAENLAADVVDTLASREIDSVDALIGHSLGAAVGMELAHSRPGLALRLVVEDPPGQTRADDIEFQRNLEREVHEARRDPEAEVQRELAENPRWLVEDARQDVEGRALCDLDGILASLRSNTGVRAPELAPQLQVPALYLIADPQRSALGTQRRTLIESMPTGSVAIEFDSGHTIHRDRFEDYTATIVEWLRAAI